MISQRFAITLHVITLCALACLACGCRDAYRKDLDYSHRVVQTWSLDDLMFDGQIVQFETVFWEPDDSVSLRELIVNDQSVSGRDVLEIGTGTGLISILCLQNGAKSVIATDINSAAVACARYNAAILLPDQALDVRQVPASDPSAYSVLDPTQRFDLIISNPPWEDGTVAKPAEHAFYDPSFALMDSLLDGLPKRLNTGGRCLLAYGHVPAIRRLKIEAEKRGFEFKQLDERELDSLPKDFLPGMLLEIRPPQETSIVSGGRFTTNDGQTALRASEPQNDDKGNLKDSNVQPDPNP
ncbi:MAG: methyltransferase [Rubripirellula sp.]|nr:methyltransferase [Rubripirellula sp.]